VIAGGGTAGHVYPGIALAGALRELRPSARISFVGTTRGIETTAVPAAGFPLHTIDVVPWARTLGAKRYLAPLSLVRATAQASKIVAAEHTSVVVGMGGYASIPVVLAARSKRIPAVLHEQNAVPGIANVLGARVTKNIALVFDEARAAFPRGADVRIVGNPIRPAIAALDRFALRDEARSALGLDASSRTVVIFGGSLGAARLNDAAAGLADAWKESADRQALVITGRQHVDEVAARLPRGGAVRVAGYVDRMEYVYAAADVVVSRAGATTVAELSAAGVPAILVPYPYARRDHQTANARSLERAGGALVVPNDEATPEHVARTIDMLLDEPGRLAMMSEKSKGFGKPEAGAVFAAWVAELGERRV
jgi:UDP-N-acetylglucosamine--N-acetylmuramyl-(pentapeptide) pyrophosphoryl-undecaprenol N-acetylglucosamine transferase